MRAFGPACGVLACATVLFAVASAQNFGTSFSLGRSGASGNINLPLVNGRVEFGGPAGEIVSQVQKTIQRLPTTIQFTKDDKEDLQRKIKEANSTRVVSKTAIEVNGQTIEIPQLTEQNAAKKSKEVSETMNTFADTLRSVTNEDECDCDPKDSAKEVKKIIEATSNLSQDMLRCLLDTLKSSIKTREATLIRTIVKE